MSSTFSDLQESRAAVFSALARLSYDAIAMETYAADDVRPLDRALADVAKADVYIGVFAWRYGFIPPGENRSITELEYREALRLGKTCLLFLLAEDAPWPRRMIDREPDIGYLERLRDELAQQHTVSFFSSADELGAVVTAALANLQLAATRPPVTVQQRLDQYYQRLVEVYGGVDLDALTPPRAEGYLQVGLTSVFVEPYVVADTTTPAEGVRESLEPLYDPLPARPCRRLLEAVAAPATPAVVLLGDPGSGKSTALHYLLLALAGARAGTPPRELADHLPVLIRLRDYVEFSVSGGHTDVLDYLDHQARIDGTGLERDLLERHLASGGRTLMLLDGLDEVIDPPRRAAVADEIAAFRAEYPQARVIVTSRLVGYARQPLTEAGFLHLTLQGLDDDQIGEFLGRWFPRALSDRPEEAEPSRIRLLDALRHSASLRELGASPMALTILAVVTRRHEALPRNRRALFQHATAVMIDQWKTGGPEFLDDEDKRELLGRLALHMELSDGRLAANSIDGEALTAVIADYIRARHQLDLHEARTAAGRMVDRLQERNFVVTSLGGGRYGFVHRAFLEFYCAEAIVAKFRHEREYTFERVRSLFREHWADPSWREVLRLVSASLHDSDTASLISLLTDEVNASWPPGPFAELPWNLSLAVQCLSEVRR